MLSDQFTVSEKLHKNHGAITGNYRELKKTEYMFSAHSGFEIHFVAYTNNDKRDCYSSSRLRRRLS